jgi:hypothetical protein
MSNRHVPSGKALPDRILEILQEKGSITTIEMYKTFKEYKTNSLPSAIQVLRARGYNIKSQTISLSALGHPLTKYILIKLPL